MTGDEKWIFYDNPKKKKYYAKPNQSLPSTSISTPRPNIHGSKIMLCIWWDQKNLVYYELLKPGDSITSDWYTSIGYNWFVWAVHCEKNGRNTSKDMIKLFFMTTLGLISLKIYLETLKWDVFTAHSPYSPDIAPSDYWLFRRMEGSSKSPIHFFRKNRKLDRLQRRSFFRDGIRKLPERWEKVVGSNGQYFNSSVHSFWNKCIFEHKKTNRTNLYSQYKWKSIHMKIYFLQSIISS